ncbi:uncharacterized protein B0H18DRAFT_1209859 [Fomitopsis serialis]|uniref:uncharacterized protein n=1 Tax=Fomitopsis serialis TaxID=139415 RepID=UPI0020075FAA|nr:uncharacterized protein B0H18DRAFT_1209859 [Neoantrodia serialis]KAH9929416.1 hypothetical protein B0H18DRAFT_1209859 [Neoantrodia serialis]
MAACCRYSAFGTSAPAGLGESTPQTGPNCRKVAQVPSETPEASAAHKQSNHCPCSTGRIDAPVFSSVNWLHRGQNLEVPSGHGRHRRGNRNRNMTCIPTQVRCIPVFLPSRDRAADATSTEQHGELTALIRTEKVAEAGTTAGERHSAVFGPFPLPPQGGGPDSDS